MRATCGDVAVLVKIRVEREAFDVVEVLVPVAQRLAIDGTDGLETAATEF